MHRTVGCDWTVVATKHTKFTQLNPPIKELIKIPVPITTYPEKKLGNFQNGGIVNVIVFSFSEIVMVMINW